MSAFLVEMEFEGNLKGLGEGVGVRFLHEEEARDGTTGKTGAQPARLAGNMYLVIPDLHSTRRPLCSSSLSKGQTKSILPLSIFVVVAQRLGALPSVAKLSVTQRFSGNRMVDGIEGCFGKWRQDCEVTFFLYPHCYNSNGQVLLGYCCWARSCCYMLDRQKEGTSQH
jgi:hypothetical protein